MTLKIIVRSALLLGLSVGASSAAWAAAGKVLFVAGSVSIERAGQPAAALPVGANVEQGDTIVTGAKSRAQLVMADGQRIALRAGTRFRIDEFALPPGVQTPVRAEAVQADGKSLFTLQRGGFRTRTSAVGKTNNTAYEVRTPVGTLGIRGTDYSAVFCQDDCDDAPGLTPGQPIADGLYLGVDEGQIAFAGRGLAVGLSAGEFAFIPVDNLPLERYQEPPGWLRGDGAGDFDLGGAVAREAAQTSGQLADIGNRRSPLGSGIQSTDPLVSGEGSTELSKSGSGANNFTVDFTGGELPQRRPVAFAYTGAATPFAATLTSFASTFGTDALGNLTAFLGPFGATAGSLYNIGSASQADLGAHAPTGLRWGRWTTGTANVTPPGAATQSLNLTNQSLHWLLGANATQPPVLPIAGTQTYILVGGTSPTNNLGAIGTLGSAFLSADFTNRSINSALTFNLGGVDWYASGVAPIGADGFAGAFSNVTVAGLVPGSGEFSGFFTSAAIGNAPAGVGLSYFARESTNQLGIASGVLALAQGQGQAPAAPPPPRRNVAYAVGNLPNLAAFNAVTAANNSVFIFNGGNLQRGPGVLTRGVAANSGLFDGAAATNVLVGSNAATGLAWGYWTTGALGLPAGGTQSLQNQAFHWIAGPAFGPSAVLPVSGTRSYVLLGGTPPSDLRGNFGTLGGALLTADFTNRTVQATLAADIANVNYFAQGQGSYLTGSDQFAGNFTTLLVNGSAIGATGSLSGFLVEPAFGGATASGAALTYSWVPGALVANNDVISGALAFTAGQGTAPQALPTTNIAFSLPMGANGAIDAVSRVQRRDLIDSNLALSEFRAPLGAGAAPLALDFFSATAGAAQIDPAIVDAGTGIVLGRWHAGQNNGRYRIRPADPMGVDSFQSLAGQSLWYAYSDRPTSAVLPISGSRTYVLNNFGAHDNLERAATGAAAFLAADFTNRTVTTTLRVDFSPTSYWWATGQAPIGIDTNTFAGNFSDVQYAGVTGGSGSQSGFLSEASGNSAAGAGIAFNLSFPTAGPSLFANGALQLVAGAGSPPPPPPPPGGARSLAFAHPGLAEPAPSNVVVPFADFTRVDLGDLVLDAQGDPVEFASDSPFQGFNGLAFYEALQANSIGTSDAATDLRWGIWSGGPGNIELPPNGTPAPQNWGNAGLAWILGPVTTAPPMLPSTGTLSFAVAGATDVQTLGGTGRLLASTFEADFDDGSVNFSLAANVGINVWRASGQLTFDNQTGEILGTTVGSVGRIFPASGLFQGFFVAPGQGTATLYGAGLSYVLVDAGQDLPPVSGTIAFTEGAGLPPLPEPTNRDVAFHLPGELSAVVPLTGADYDIDSNFDLTRFLGPDGSLRLVSASNGDTGFNLQGMLRWGRWSGGLIQLVDPQTGSGPTIDLGNESLPWIVSADRAAPPTLPVTGVASYTFAGGTSPFANAIVNGSLTANFTNSTVTSNLTISGGATWTATGSGPIQGNQFAGAYTGTFVGAQTSPITGSFAGFFSTPTDVPTGAPAGAGLVYQLQTVFPLANPINGAAAFGFASCTGC